MIGADPERIGGIIYLISGLRTSWDPLRGAGKRCYGERHLEYHLSLLNGWMDGKSKYLYKSLGVSLGGNHDLSTCKTLVTALVTCKG